jgi:predicted 3-demethylubiquinone-9 3-methyltransferase (glyoxalase superfamily)
LTFILNYKKNYMQDITPFLWFNNNAEEAVSFYVSLFGDAEIRKVKRTGPNLPGNEGAVFSIEFTIKGQEFIAMNGGPMYQFSEAISFFVNVHTQEECDRFYDGLAEGGQEMQCGWVKDRFGVTWQIVPAGMGQLLFSPDAAASQRAMQAMMKMKKLDLPAIKKAYDGN